MAVNHPTGNQHVLMASLAIAVLVLLAVLVSELSEPPLAEQTTAVDPAVTTIKQDYPEQYGKITVIPAKPGQPGTSLWESLSAGFDLDDKSEAAVQQALEEFRIHRRSTQYLLARSTPYLWEIAQEVQARRLPGELALLPAIESRFNPLAQSHRRALGLWQFMPGTGNHMGLEQNWWFDARLDVTESTHAALDYLEYLYQRFGEWTLALAAYNCGEARLQRAIDLADGNNDFWEISLPMETRKYVPRLLALSLLIEDPDDFNIKLPDLPNQQTTDTLIFDRQIDLALVAKMAKVDLSTLQQLNPSLLRWATPPDGPHRLRLPAGKAKQLQSAMSTVPTSHWTQWLSYMVREGDNLNLIAQQLGIQINDLKLINQLNSMQVRVGETLFLPTSALYASNDTVWSSTSPTAPVNAVRVDYLIKQGDTLWDIARMFGVSIEELHRWNGLAAGSILRPGKSLIVWIATDSKQSA